MPVNITVVDKKFIPSWGNFSTMENASTELNMNATEQSVAEFTVELGWFSDLKDARLVNAVNGLGIIDLTATKGLIIKDGYDFLKDGHSVGDRCDLYVFVQRFGGGVVASGIVDTAEFANLEITAISEGRLEFNINSLGLGNQITIFSTQLSQIGVKNFTFGEDGVGTVEARLKGRPSNSDNIRFSPALIPNSDTEIINLLTGDKPVYSFNGVNNNFNEMSLLTNNKASDFLFSKQVRKGNTKVDGWAFNQFFFEDRRKSYRDYIFKFRFNNYLNHIDGESAFDRFYRGINSIKLVFSAEFRTKANDPKTAKIVEFTQDNGNVGYYNENFSGGNNNYRVEDLQYINNLGVQQINISEGNIVRYKVRSLANPFVSQRNFAVSHTCLPNRDIYEFSDKYTQNQVLGLDVRNGTMSATTWLGSQSFQRRITCDILESHLIQIEITFNYSQSVGLPIRELYDKGDEYILGCIIDNGQGSTLTDRVTLLVDRNTFEKNTDIEGLLDLIKAEYSPVNYPLNNFTAIQAFNEDVVRCKFEFCANLNLDAVIENIQFVFYAKDINNVGEWEIQRFPLPFNNVTNIGKRQIVNIEQPRGLQIPEGEFNIIKVKSTNYDQALNKQYYEVEVSFRINWQEWLRLESVFNLSPEIYFDESKPFNGFNQKSSNYLQNKLIGALLLDIRQGDNTTIYRLEGNRIEVKDYESPYGQGLATWGATVLETFDENDNPLGELILQGQTTKFKITHNTLVNLQSVINEIAFAVRIEESEQSGFALAEYNSILGDYTGSPFSNVQMNVFNNRIELTGEVLFNVQANISSRIYLTETTDGVDYGQFDNSFNDSFNN